MTSFGDESPSKLSRVPNTALSCSLWVAGPWPSNSFKRNKIFPQRCTRAHSMCLSCFESCQWPVLRIQLQDLQTAKLRVHKPYPRVVTAWQTHTDIHTSTERNSHVFSIHVQSSGSEAVTKQLLQENRTVSCATRAHGMWFARRVASAAVLAPWVAIKLDCCHRTVFQRCLWLQLQRCANIKADSQKP